MTEETLPPYLPPLVARLRRRRIQIGVGDLQALRLALRAGFGLSSADDLRELCVALWAKSPVETEIVRAAFAELDESPQWNAAPPAPGVAAAGQHASLPGPAPEDTAGLGEPPAAGEPDTASAVWNLGTSLTGDIPRAAAPSPGLVLVPQYPLTSREVAQAWRHLRRPTRQGPAVELDVDATIRERSRRGFATPPVLIPRRVNAARLLMLLDRQGSMTPFHRYVDYVTAAIRDAGRIDHVEAVYFHDLPGSSQDRGVLGEIADPFQADLDDVLDNIGPLRGGRVYEDHGLTRPRALDGLFAGLTEATAVLVISDAGAARRQFDLERLLDSVALAKAARTGGSRLAWLNPVPRRRWGRTTAGQLARYVPMFPFSRQGLHQAVDTLRGRPVYLERPL